MNLCVVIKTRKRGFSDQKKGAEQGNKKRTNIYCEETADTTQQHQ